MKKELEAAGARWTALSPEQWQFMRGVYSAQPPAGGVPVGDGAAIVQDSKDLKAGAIVVFVDGKMACGQPVPVGSNLVETLMDLGTVRHAGLSQ